MKNSAIDPRTCNRSELIRTVCNIDPAQSNKQIREEVFRRYGIKVGGNLVCSAVGTREQRQRKAAKYPLIIAEAKRFLEHCGILSVEEGCYWIRAAARS